MPNELPSDDLKNLWQSQNVEATPMSLDEIRRRAGRFHSRIRWRNMREYAAMAFVVATFGYYIYKFPDPLMRAGSVLVIAGAIYMAWQLHKRAPANTPPADGVLASCLEFHIQELERQRHALSTVWSWYLAPALPGLIVFLTGCVSAGRASLRHHGALLVLWWIGLMGIMGLAFWGVWKLNQRAAWKLQRRIDELQSLGRQA
jgi:hypothetical protein